jgi:hypothetical protein
MGVLAMFIECSHRFVFEPFAIMTSQEAHQTFILNCVQWGRDTDRIFDVSITSNSKITVLRQAICEEASQGWLDIDITLWNVSTSSSTEEIVFA